jgi:hypothetical protein
LAKAWSADEEGFEILAVLFLSRDGYGKAFGDREYAVWDLSLSVQLDPSLSLTDFWNALKALS